MMPCPLLDRASTFSLHCSVLQFVVCHLELCSVPSRLCSVYSVQWWWRTVQDGQTETLATEPANQDDSGNDDQADDNEHHDC